MRDEYIIQRQGKDYVLYKGLLAEAHERFIAFSIDTELISSGDVPILKATFEGENKDGRRIKTTGTGTAGRATDKKGPAVDAPIEMAETRAKARALRDAVNVGETAFEEMPTGEEQEAEGKLSRETLARLKFLATTYAEAIKQDPEVHLRAFARNEGPLENFTEGQGKTWIGRYEHNLEKLEARDS